MDPLHFVDLVNGRFFQTSADDLKSAFAAAARADHIVLHFHGGLVSRTNAVKGAQSLIPTYQAVGAHPIFFIWNSDLPSTIKGSWREIPHEKAFQRLVRRLVQLAMAKLGNTSGRGDALQLEAMREIPADLEDVAEYVSRREPGLIADESELSPSQIEQAEASLASDEVLKQESAAIALFEQESQGKPFSASRSGTVTAAPKPTLMSRGVREDIRQDFFETPGEMRGRGTFLLTLARHGVAILINVIKRCVQRRDHGLYTTIVEEVMRKLYVDSLGQLAWEMMKKDTLDAFGDDENCGGSECLRLMAEWWKPGRRITLVGHSTGAIYIGNLLMAADRWFSELTPFEVVFLAPACTFEFMYDRLSVFRRRVVDRIRVFGLGEAAEHGYFEVPVLYQGSLLYMVSGLFEMSQIDKELVGMQRYYSNHRVYDERAVNEVRAYLNQRTVWSPEDARDGWRTAAQRHGGFAEDPLTLTSLSHILTNGFA